MGTRAQMQTEGGLRRCDPGAAADRLLVITRQLALELHPRVRKIETLGLEDSLEVDFGLDSLARTELAVRLERELGARPADEVLAQAETPADLVRALAGEAAVTRAAPAAATAAGAAPAAELPATVHTLVEALEWRAAQHPDRPHLLLLEQDEAPRPITFAALRDAARTAAAGLVHAGVAPGDHVGIMQPTGLEFFAAFYGAMYARAVPVPLYPPARPSQLESHLHRVAGILENAQATVLVAHEAVKPLARLLRAEVPSLRAIATLSELARHGAHDPHPGTQADDVAFLQYTSGSTGRPKGVILSHANILANLAAMQRVTAANSADCFVSWLPLYHDMGLIGACHGALLYAYTLVLMSPIAFLTRPVRWLRAIHRFRATMTAAPNFAYQMCLDKVEDREIEGLDLASLRLAFSGAEPVSPDTIERFGQRFARYGLRREAMTPVYGLAEGTLGVTFPPIGRGPRIVRIDRHALLEQSTARDAAPDDPVPLRLASCGTALPGHAVRIADASGCALPERSQGRVQFRGPSATRGYHRNPEESARLRCGEWLDTGDLGFLAEGELYITGRAKDVIIRGGHNIHPLELEEAIGRLPGIRKGGVAVFAAADPQRGTERIVVLAETRATEPEPRAHLEHGIRRLTIDLLGMPPDDVVLAPARTVLKTSSGKIRRAACREAYERGELGAALRPPWRQVLRLTAAAARAWLAERLRRARARIWSARALAVGAALAPCVWLLVVLTPGLERRRRIARTLTRTGLRLCGLAPRVSGTDPQALPAGCVLVANHASYLDGILMTAVLPPCFAFVAKRELAAQRFAGTLLARLGSVFVERDEVRQAAASGARLEAPLRAGESLVVFPEGTFRRDAGLLPFHMGAFLAAAAAGAPIVPVTIRGTRDVLPADVWAPRREPIEVIIGEPLRAAARDWGGAVAARDQARARILARLDEPEAQLASVGR